MYNERITRFWRKWSQDTRFQAIKSIRPLKKQYTGRNKPISPSQSLLDTNCRPTGSVYPSKNTCNVAFIFNLKINTRHRASGDPGTINYAVMNAIRRLYMVTITLVIAAIMLICFIAFIIIVCMLRMRVLLLRSVQLQIY